MELLKALVENPCVTGFEKKNNLKIKYYLENLCDSCYEDALGNLFGSILCGKENAPKVMMCAHYDNIGLIVTEILQDGFVKIAPLGGIDERVLAGSEVILHGDKDIYGIIGLRPIHILTAEQTDKVEKIKNLVVDTGFKSDDLKEIIRVGTPVSFKPSFRVMANNISANFLDNKGGVYSLLRLAEHIDKSKMQADLVIMLSVSEELGRRGASCGAERENPHMAITVDATFGNSPECQPYTTNKMGAGPVICKGPTLNRFYTNQLINCAQFREIPYQVEVESGDTGTDAFVIETARNGIPSVLVSFPLKYMHTGIETVLKEDIENLSQLLEEFLYNFQEVQYA
ncbi:MAG: M42 family peptidase [Clostridia bacterium]|nr:M42 family peptidase [Clostridia bacterium]